MKPITPKSLTNEVKDTTPNPRLTNEKLKQQVTLTEEALAEVDKERKIAETAAQELKKFQEAVENASDLVTITDTEGVIVYINKAAHNITGYKREEMIGQRPSLWGKQMPAEFYQKMWDQIKNKKQVFEGEVNNKRKSGQQYVASLQIVPVLNKKGDVKFFVGVERDITAQKEVDQMKSEFVSIAAHQLRAPLTSTKWFIEVLLSGDNGPLSHEQEDILKQLNDGNERLIKLVEELLDISRIETGSKKFSINQQDCNVVSIINDTLATETVLAKDKSVTVKKTEGLPTEVIMAVDENKISQVFNNLVHNAIKYTPKNGTVEIGIEGDPTAEQVTFFVKDNGMGIPANQQDQIFQKFFRADNVVKEQVDGTGLGLYIVKAIVEGHGGQIRFESEESKGTTFFITLPRHAVKPSQTE